MTRSPRCSALDVHLESLFGDSRSREVAQVQCLTMLLPERPGRPVTRSSEPARRTLRHGPVQMLMAARQIRSDLAGGHPCEYLSGPLPRALVRQAGRAVAEDDGAHTRLLELVRRNPELCAMGASILHAADSGWIPARQRSIRLGGAYLARATWPKVHLRGAALASTDLSDADLRGANLVEALAPDVVLRGARLGGASMERFAGPHANLVGADLSGARASGARLDAARLKGATCDGADLQVAQLVGADLTRASFAGADLRGATLRRATISEADFSSAALDRADLADLDLRTAILTGASLTAATLMRSNMEDVHLPGAQLTTANLRGAYLTGSCMPRAHLAGADLRDTGLAEVEWERADLRNADLRGASFHLGSSRSGRVPSVIASEGTRTGFYTDEYHEQSFKAPEEIRKANLCGADLRGARIDDVDFYLVDLRGARYTSDQELHLRRCRAILESPRRAM